MAELSGSAAPGVQWRIAVTQREQPAAERRQACDALYAGYAAWLIELLGNVLVLPLPNLADPAQVARQVDAMGVNGLLLSGGGDLGQQPRREAIERVLLSRAAQCVWPVLGICRGMQMLHRHAGGEVIQLLQPIGQAHPVTDLSVDPDPVSGAAAGRMTRRAEVNSWHRFGILEPAAPWQVLARADDGSVEAMRHRHLPWLALMWHPERPEGAADLCRPWLRSIFRDPSALGTTTTSR